MTIVQISDSMQGSFIQQTIWQFTSEFWISFTPFYSVRHKCIYLCVLKVLVADCGSYHRSLQNNQLSGQINVLAKLKLDEL